MHAFLAGGGRLEMKNGQDIQSLMEDFIAYKRSLGHPYITGEWHMKWFLRFAGESGGKRNVLHKEMVRLALASVADSPGRLYNEISFLREFGKYLVLRGYEDAYVVPSGYGSCPTAFPPYFFTDGEVSAFFTAADRMSPLREFPGRELVFPALFRLLCCCGLRCKEARELKCDDVHLEQRFLDIMQSKGPKSRRVFVSKELADWLGAYDGRIRSVFPSRKYFFPRKHDTCYSTAAIGSNFRALWLQAFPGFQFENGHPRAYDFRHHFIWTNINGWAREGDDVMGKLPYLMRYVGHCAVKSTLYYFRFVPEFYPVYEAMAKSSESLLPEVPDGKR